jgi:Zn-dependent oligopeptidase
VRKISRVPPGRTAVGVLDDISNDLCHAIDTANFCTIAHAKKDWQAASVKAVTKLNGFLAGLNTNPALWKALSQSMPHADAEGWSQEERIVGNSLLAEFRQAGMELGPEVAREYRALKAREEAVGLEIRQFQGEGLPPPVSSFLELGLGKQAMEFRDIPRDTLPV